MAGMAVRRFTGFWLVLLFLSAPVLAEPGARALARTLRLDEVAQVMRDEGVAYSRELDAEMLGGRGGAYFADLVARLYDPRQITETITLTMAKRMSDRHIAQSIAFFETERGQRIITLETAARVAMADPDVEENARTNFGDLQDSDDSRLAEIDRFVAINDLLERNVAGALSANYQFYLGLVNGGSIEMDESQILSDVWRQEAEIRVDTKGWLYGYLLMAYRPLSDADLRAYSEFSATPAGESLNAALFDGFDVIYRDISYALGLAVARAMKASEL